MNLSVLLLTILATCPISSVAAASRIEAPVFAAIDEGQKIRQSKELKHPWTKDQPLPSSFAECGLESDAKLVFTDIYLDGGSRSFALRDRKGAYLIFCTTRPLGQSRSDGTVDWSEFFVIGVKHYTDKAGVLVPRGSPTEQMLLKAIGGRIVQVSDAVAQKDKKPFRSPELPVEVKPFDYRLHPPQPPRGEKK